MSQALSNLNVENKFVLDVGCGNTPFIELFQESSLVNCDIYPYPEVDIVCDLSKDNVFKLEVFDIIVLSNMLEHVEYPREFMKSLCSILKPGGHVIITVPFLLAIHQVPYDFQRFTRFGLDSLMKSSGLEITMFNSFADANVLTQEFAYLARREIDQYPNSIKKSFAKFLAYIRSGVASRTQYLIRKLLNIPDISSGDGISPYGYMLIARKIHPTGV